MFDEMVEAVLAGQHVGDLSKGIDLQRAAALMKRLDIELELTSNKKSVLQSAYDHVRLALIPGIMEELGINSATVEGIGRVALTSDAYVSVPASARADFQQWLVDNGFDDLLTQTVNASTLKAWVMSRIRTGQELPPIVKVTPFTRASITKVS